MNPNSMFIVEFLINNKSFETYFLDKISEEILEAVITDKVSICLGKNYFNRSLCISNISSLKNDFQLIGVTNIGRDTKIKLYMNITHPSIYYLLTNFKYSITRIRYNKDKKELYWNFPHIRFNTQDIGQNKSTWWNEIRGSILIKVSTVLKYTSEDTLGYLYKDLMYEYSTKNATPTLKFKISKVLEKIPNEIKLLEEVE